MNKIPSLFLTLQANKARSIECTVTPFSFSNHTTTALPYISPLFAITNSPHHSTPSKTNPHLFLCFYIYQSSIWVSMAALLDSQKKEPEVEAVKKEEEQEKEEENNRVPPMSPSLAAQGAQLTIFYNGSISVYDGITPAKAQAIMLIAAASAASSKTESINKTTINMMAGANAAAAAAAANGGFPSTVSAAAALTRSLSRQSSSVAAATAGPPQAQMPSSPGVNSICKLQAEIPHARRQSLQQFLEKRRSRLVSRAPYASVKKSDEGLEAGLEGKPQLS